MINRARSLVVAAALVALPTLASAQDKQFDVGTKLFNVGVMLADEVYGGVGAGAGFEVGFKDIQGQVKLGIGGSVGFLHNSTDGLLSAYGYSTTVIPIVAFVNGHYQLANVPKLDLYAGPVAGIALSRFSFDNGYCNVTGVDCKDTDSNVAAGIQAGARWALTPKVLGWAQLSGGSSALPLLNAGVSFKF